MESQQRTLGSHSGKFLSETNNIFFEQTYTFLILVSVHYLFFGCDVFVQQFSQKQTQSWRLKVNGQNIMQFAAMVIFYF